MTNTPSSRDAPYSTFSPVRLDALSDEELDTLPFGVIGLDREGRILRYNVAEARFARLDRGRVLGKSFFGEIARCTATPEFLGRFETFVRDPATAPVRFPFVFAFRFGAQQVDVEMGGAPGSGRVYLCVNRRRFLPRTKDVPPSKEAPLLAELEPGADKLGVLRDDDGRRRVDVEVAMFEALFASNARARGPEADAFLRDWGVAWGRVAVVDLETDVLKAREKLLGELSMADAMAAVAGHLERRKLGRLVVDFSHAPRGAIVLAVERNVFGETSTRGCAVLEGFLAVVLSHMAKRPLVVREASCRSRGAASCELVAIAATRAPALERAVEGGARSIDDVVRAIGEEAHRGGR